jgi:DNA polymerase III sliding clamp (beta) subunit (PCNA family)
MSMGWDESHCTAWLLDNVISKLSFLVAKNEKKQKLRGVEIRIQGGKVLTAKKPRYCLSISKKLITLIGNKRGI